MSSGSFGITRGSDVTDVVTNDMISGIAGTILLHDSALEIEDVLKASSAPNASDTSFLIHGRSKTKIIARVPTQTNKIRAFIKEIKPIHGIDTLDESAINYDALMSEQCVTHVHRIDSINDIKNRDILLIIKDRIKNIFKNNLLINVFNPFKKIDAVDVLRIFTHLFLLLIFGYISKFSTLHVILLPIMVQNVIDIIV
jgi:hypothetical protein